jgi:hypothetical protein
MGSEGFVISRTSPGLRFKISNSSGINLLDSNAATHPSGTAFKTNVYASRRRHVPAVSRQISPAREFHGFHLAKQALDTAKGQGSERRVSELTNDLKVDRLTRQRLAAEEGAKALEEAAKKAADVRANMARLRELRLAKEAQGVRMDISVGKQSKPKPRKRFR